MSIIWTVTLPRGRLGTIRWPALLIRFHFWFSLKKLVVEGTTPRHDFLGRISDQIIWADGKTDAIYLISLLISLISFACFTATKSFPPRWMIIVTSGGFWIIISWNLALRCSQRIPLVPSQTTLLPGIPRFNDPLIAAISFKWVINESPMSQMSVSGYKEKLIRPYMNSQTNIPVHSIWPPSAKLFNDITRYPLGGQIWCTTNAKRVWRAQLCGQANRKNGFS